MVVGENDTSHSMIITKPFVSLVHKSRVALMPVFVSVLLMSPSRLSPLYTIAPALCSLLGVINITGLGSGRPFPW
ncbi:hypothetical protein SODG_001147 [Sodalis praecaptivus]